jgi:hypothetical protein
VVLNATGVDVLARYIGPGTMHAFPSEPCIKFSKQKDYIQSKLSRRKVKNAQEKNVKQDVIKSTENNQKPKTRQKDVLQQRLNWRLLRLQVHLGIRCNWFFFDW